MNVLVDVDYPESDQAFKLCQLLENDCADILPIRLWRWGLVTQNRTGRFCATPLRVAQIVRWSGDAEKLTDSLVGCGFLEPVAGGFRICGWDRNARMFKERERLRKIRRTQNARVRVREIDAGCTEPSSSSSSSSSSSNKSVDTNIRARAYAPDEHNTRPMQPFVLSEARRLAIAHRRDSYPRNDTADMAFAAGKIYLAYPDDFGAVLEKYFADEFYKRYGHDLVWLSRNIGRVAGRDVEQKSAGEPIAERIKRQDAANKAALDEFS